MRIGGAALSILLCNEDCSLVHISVLFTEKGQREYRRVGERAEERKGGKGGGMRIKGGASRGEGRRGEGRRGEERSGGEEVEKTRGGG